MIDILRENAAATEERMRPTAAGLAVVRSAGAFRLGTPPAYGGSGKDAATIVRLLADIARGCPSTAWVASTCMTSKQMLSFGDFTDGTLGEVFADPDAIFCAAGVPAGRGTTGPDGVRLTGRWDYLSGCEDARWACLGAMVDGAFAITVLPMAELTIDPTWQVAGMRGTGSHTVVADDVLIPSARVVSGPRLHYPPDTRTLQLWGLGVLAPVVGATVGALDVVRAMFASDRKPFFTSYARMADSPGARHWLAEAAMLTQRAERTLLALAAAIDADSSITDEQSSRMAQDRADAGADCRAALERMLDLHGASGFRTSNALRRFWLDVSVASRHPQLNPYLAVEGYGRALTGSVGP
ncbi:acyl-CoA dehydrogenase family protein [Actinoplanes sp. NPDC048967]|uniref:acyl-CoA dehydrogenase family protein n=1 Tax=Actinoplanes sp. NPDC048967 TaxID=3155269 RepID=UPI0033CA4DFF